MPFLLVEEQVGGQVWAASVSNNAIARLFNLRSPKPTSLSSSPAQPMPTPSQTNRQLTERASRRA